MNKKTNALIPVNARTSDLSDPRKRHSFLLNSFLTNRNANTMRNYQKAITDFAGFIGVKTNEEAVAYLFSRPQGEANAVALAYRQSLSQKKLSSNTVNIRLAALKSMAKLARVLGMVPWTLEVESLKVEAYRDTAGPGKEMILGVLKMLEEKTDQASYRDLAVIRLLYTQGLRRKEAGGLNLEDYDPKGSKLWILGKARTEQEPITVATKTKVAIDRWLAVRRPGEGPLFTNFDPTKKGGERLSDKSIWRITQKYGLGRPHGLRHSAITEALDKTKGDVRAVKRFSRHKKLDTLMLYDDNRKDLGGEVAQRLDDET